MVKDGLWDASGDVHMGVCAEQCATTQSISREQQDNFAVSSYTKAAAAAAAGKFDSEIAPIEVPAARRGAAPTVVSTDEQVSGLDEAKLRKLRPAFDKANGTVTAGNASSLADGASALVLMSEAKALELGVKVLARVVGYADAARAPVEFTVAPALAIPKALAKAGIEIGQVDLFEINEAFSVVALANQQMLGIADDSVNVHGGAVALGHPLGCSGARIVVTLIHALAATSKKIGCAGVCNGGGGATALVLERGD